VKDVEVIHKIVFDRPSTNKIKMNHIKIMLCSHYIGIDRLERSKLLQGDPLVEAFEISVKQSDRMTVSHKFLKIKSRLNHQ